MAHLRLVEVRPVDLVFTFANVRPNSGKFTLDLVVTTLADAFLFSQRERIVQLASNNGLAGVYPEAEFPLAGGLLSYGPNLADLFRRAASYVDKIVKGAPPALLPIEQPSKLDLVINLRTAHALGLSIRRDFLLRADEVIE